MQEFLNRAVSLGIITRAQADQLMQLPAVPAESVCAPVALAPSFTFTNVLYYLGGLIAIGAMTLFMTFGWQTFHGLGIAVIALLYAAAASTSSRYLLEKGFPTPAGILLALAIALVPLAIYGCEQALNMWPTGGFHRDFHYWIDWRWMWMEIGILIAGSVLLYLFRLPFAVMPLAVTLWYMSLDFAPVLAGGR